MISVVANKKHIMYNVVMNKLCIYCKEQKNSSFFHKDSRRPDLLYPYCKSCRRKYYGVKERVHKKIGELDGFIIVDDSRYPCILLPEGRVRVHLYVAEKKVGRKLIKGEVVHHIDGNKKNWNAENICVLLDKTHRVMEAHKIHGYAPTLSCVSCGKKRTYSRHVISKNIIYPDRYQCSRCYYASGGPGGRHERLKDLTNMDD